ncbi:MAG: hypothetical protein LBT66_07305 [Methanobrevibacter sp.]|jgi:hypothetical protein|nr:hypothetical protein [Candidatus Methanovirga meridionalis]
MNFKINGLLICALLILSSLSIGMLSASIPEKIEMDNKSVRSSKLITETGMDFQIAAVSHPE